MSSGKIHLVRHAHALHNVNNDVNLPDPVLTDKGRRQATKLAADFPFSQPSSSSIALVMTSPLQRAIQTTLLAFSKILDQRFYKPNSGQGVANGVDLIIDPYLQEEGDEPANTGSPLSQLIHAFPELDFSLLEQHEPHWEAKRGDFAPDVDAVQARADKVRQRLREQLSRFEGGATATQKDIVVVTHAGFIMRLARDPTLALGQTEWASFELEILPVLVPVPRSVV